MTAPLTDDELWARARKSPPLIDAAVRLVFGSDNCDGLDDAIERFHIGQGYTPTIRLDRAVCPTMLHRHAALMVRRALQERGLPVCPVSEADAAWEPLTTRGAS